MFTSLHILSGIVIVIGVGLILAVGVLTVLQDLLERTGPDEEQRAGPERARSQFAWRSRPHSREPD